MFYTNFIPDYTQVTGNYCQYLKKSQWEKNCFEPGLVTLTLTKTDRPFSRQYLIRQCWPILHKPAKTKLDLDLRLTFQGRVFKKVRGAVLTYHVVVFARRAVTSSYL